MEYYINLANEQHNRYVKFRNANPEMDEETARVSFFGQRYECHISYSISNGLAAWKGHLENQ